MPNHNCSKEGGDVARITESVKVAHHRIDDLEKQSDLLMELVATVRVIAEQMTSINEKVGSNTGLINANRDTISGIKEMPAREHEAYKKAFVVAAITGFVTSVVGMLLGKGF